MSTFASEGFDVSSYAAFRPVYDEKLYDLLAKYGARGGEGSVALDLGCGTGQVTQALLKRFEKVVGVDPSSSMIQQAKFEAERWEGCERVVFAIAAAEDVHLHIEEKTVDLVTAGQSAHWFDQSKIWNSLERVLKPGGIVAFWGYGSFRIAGRADVTPLLRDFAANENGLGPFWQQPGTSIIDSRYCSIPFPNSSAWSSLSKARIFFEGPNEDGVTLPYRPLAALLQSGLLKEPESRTDPIIARALGWSDMAAYFRTWSAVHSYQEHHPEDKERRGRGPEGDIVDQFIESLRQAIGESASEPSVYWPVFLMIVTKTTL